MAFITVIRVHMLRKFVEPRPVEWVIALTEPLVRIFVLQGVPILRAIPLLNKIPVICGVTKVREIDIRETDIARLKSVHGTGKAVVYGPNHPEYFTDWMLDKYLISKISRQVACWGSHFNVNGMGRLMQKFWLANNLIAQIPGNSKAAIDYSVKAARAGNGVWLHPEGGVGWHANHIAPIFPGALTIAWRALQQAQASGHEIEAYIAPIVWKLVFIEDVSRALHHECGYVEGKLDISKPETAMTPADRVFRIYNTLLRRDLERWQIDVGKSGNYRSRRAVLVRYLEDRLISTTKDASKKGEFGGILRNARRWLRYNRNGRNTAEVKELADCLAKHQALGDFAFANSRITQEEIAEHIKRLRRDYCSGSWRDALNNHVLPIPAGLRRVYIRVPEPFLVNNLSECERANGCEILRKCLQNGLDDLIEEIMQQHKFIEYPNPFVAQI